jgi:hypothetical protein
MACCPYNASSFNNTAQLDSLLRHIMPMIPETPHAMALDRVRQAYIEFARRTSLVVARMVQNYQTNVADYALVPPEGYEIYSVLGLESPGYGFVDYWGGCNYGLWNTRFDVIDNSIIRLHRPPTVDSVDGLVIYAVVIPNSCVSTIPDSIATPYGKGIAQGALADILLTPNKPWSSPQLAQINRLEYNRVILAAKHLAETNRKPGPLRAKRIRVV